MMLTVQGSLAYFVREHLKFEFRPATLAEVATTALPLTATVVVANDRSLVAHDALSLLKTVLFAPMMLAYPLV